MTSFLTLMMGAMAAGAAMAACASPVEETDPVASDEAGLARNERSFRKEAPIARVGLLVRLEAKEGYEDAVQALLAKGPEYVSKEASTVYWFGMKIGPRTFGIFDAFPDDAGRDAHIAGELAKALFAAAPHVLAQEPTIEKVDVIAKKDTWRSANVSRIRVGLLVRLEAKPETASTVEGALVQGLGAVNEEKRTPLWFAIKSGPTTFGIFDAFECDDARNEHVGSPFARGLLAAAPQLLASEPVIEPIDVIATKVAR